MRKTTWVMVLTFGALVGLIGIEHGLGEVLQGSSVPAGIVILSWPGSAFFAILGGEPALTVVPNLLLTGVLAILFSLLYLGWSLLFVQRQHGGLILILLAIAMFLAGGGIFPPVFGVILGVAATRIHAPLTAVAVVFRRLPHFLVGHVPRCSPAQLFLRCGKHEPDFHLADLHVWIFMAGRHGGQRPRSAEPAASAAGTLAASEMIGL